MTRVYRPYVSNRVVGTNWVLVGEAATMVDPLSSLGVTAALRHGTEVAHIIARSRQRPSATHRLLADYDWRVRSIGKLYNDALDGLLYRAELRSRDGIKQAGRAYGILGYLANSMYSRLEPTKSRFRQAVLRFVLGFFRVWTRAWLTAARPGEIRPRAGARRDASDPDGIPSHFAHPPSWILRSWPGRSRRCPSRLSI